MISDWINVEIEVLFDDYCAKCSRLEIVEGRGDYSVHAGKYGCIIRNGKVVWRLFRCKHLDICRELYERMAAKAWPANDNKLP